jgi:small ubiquitin-related modifier
MYKVWKIRAWISKDGAKPGRGGAKPAKRGERKERKEAVERERKETKRKKGNESLSTQLKKLMNAYCDRQSMELNSIAFLFDGRCPRAE